MPNTAASTPIRKGDRVRWNGRYSGKVESVNGQTAVILEERNLAFGRPIKWRLMLSALKVVG